MVSVTDIDAEELVLSAIINGDKQNIADIMSRVKDDDFFFKGNRKLFSLLRGMYAAGEPISPESITGLHAEDLEACKTRTNIVGFVTGFTSAKIRFEETYSQTASGEKIVDVAIKKVKTAVAYRKLQATADLIYKAVSDGKPPEDVYRAVEDAVIAREDMSDKRSYLTPKEMGRLMLDATAERMDQEKRRNEVIFTSFGRLNKLTGGFERGDLIILSAASGVGKSAFSANLARDVSMVDGKPVLYINSEMSDKQQARRYASMLSGVSHQAIREGLPVEGDDSFSRIIQAADSFAAASIYTITIPDLQINNVVAETKRMQDRFGIQIVFVDYVGRMDTINSRDVQEWQLMEAAARTLKTMAQELDIVVVMVAQLSSNGISLAKGANMKNECDLWMNLSRIGNEERAKANQFGEGIDDCWNVFLEFRKARNVETGARILMHFHGDTLTFTDDIEKAKGFCKKEEE